MNINAIKRNCMAARMAVILDSLRGSQWIANGTTAYLVEGLRLDVEAIVKLFDLTDKQRGKMAMTEKPTSDPRFCETPFDGEEETQEAGAMVFRDEIYIGLPSRDGLLYIPYEAIRHIKADYRRYAIRWRYGRPMVAVYADMLCSALIMPLDNRSAAEMRGIARKLTEPTYEWPDMEQEAADAEAEAEAMLARMMGEDRYGEDDGEAGEDGAAEADE